MVYTDGSLHGLFLESLPEAPVPDPKPHDPDGHLRRMAPHKGWANKSQHFSQSGSSRAWKPDIATLIRPMPTV